MRKVILFVGMILLFRIGLCFAQEEITITTYYPSPVGVYNNLRLFPIPAGSEPNCNSSSDEGLMYYDETDWELKVCVQTGTAPDTYDWQGGAGGFWALSSEAGHLDDIYNINTDNVGIGTASPFAKLSVQGDIDTITSGGARTTMLSTTSDTGIVSAYGSNGNLNARLNYRTGNTNHGHVGVYDENGSRRVGIMVDSVGGGRVTTYGPNGNTNVRLNYISGSTDHGHIGVYDDNGTRRVGLYVMSNRCGGVGTIGPNGSWNAVFTYLTGFPNNGYVGVLDAAGNYKAGMFVNSAGQGAFWGDIKGFRMPNPSQPGTEICYSSVEGPEAAAYVRGTGHLTDGKAEIVLPDHFVVVASPQRVTVQLTPLSDESKGLAVVEKALDRFVVRELAGGDGTYNFDYMVMAVRKGHEDYQVIRPTLEAKPTDPRE